jgi:hypothetical protein
MRKKYLLFIFLISCLSCFSQQFRKAGLIPYRKGDKWGYADTNANIVIKPQFDSISFFNGKGLAVVRKKKMLQVIKANGEIVFSVKASINDIDILDSNYLQLYNSKSGQLWVQGLKRGKIEKAGFSFVGYSDEKRVAMFNSENFNPSLYSMVQHQWLDGTEFYPDYYRGYYYPESPYGYIFTNLLPEKKDGQLTQIAVYSLQTHLFIKTIEGAKIKAFNKNHFIVYSEAVKDPHGKMQTVSVYSSKDFSFIFSVQCKDLGIENDIWTMESEKGYGIIDSTGKTIIPVIYSQIMHDDKEYHATLNDSIISVFDLKGKWIKDCTRKTPCGWAGENAYDLYKVISKDGLQGVKDKTGKIIVPFIYKHVAIFNNLALAYGKNEEKEKFVKVDIYYHPVGDLIDLRTGKTTPNRAMFASRQEGYLDTWYKGEQEKGIMLMCDDNGKFTGVAVFDKEGNLLMESNLFFNHVYQSSEKCFHAVDFSTNRQDWMLANYLLNAKGQNVLTPTDTIIRYIPNYPVIIEYSDTLSNKKGVLKYDYGFCDALHQSVLAPIYDTMYFSLDQLVLEKDGKVGLWDYMHEGILEIIPMQYHSIEGGYSYRYFVAQDEKGSTVFTYNGKKLWSCTDIISEQSSQESYNFIGFEAVNENGKFMGYYDTKGNKYFED